MFETMSNREMDHHLGYSSMNLSYFDQSHFIQDFKAVIGKTSDNLSGKKQTLGVIPHLRIIEYISFTKNKTKGG